MKATPLAVLAMLCISVVASAADAAGNQSVSFTLKADGSAPIGAQ